MSERFFVTNKGVELINKAVAEGGKVDINKVKFGSGGNQELENNYDITEVVSLTYEKNLDPLTDKYSISETDPKSILIDVIVPEEVSGVINEIGFFDRNQNLILYGYVRESDKPAGIEYEYRCWIDFENTDNSVVEVVIVSPEYEKVEKLVEETKIEFDKYIKIAKLDLSELEDSEVEEIFEMTGSGSAYPADWVEATTSDIDNLFI